MRGRQLLGRVFALTVVVRIVLLALSVAVAGLPSSVAQVLEPFNRWDAPHYLRIAQAGYRSSGEDALFIVFFPLYPAVVRIATFAVRDVLIAGLLVSWAASVGAGYLLYRVAAIGRSPAEAWRVTLLAFAFPTAYFLSAPYSEALFLFAVLGCVYATRKGRWPLTGAAGAAAAATRLAGIALLPAMAVESLRRGAGRVGRLGWVALIGLGFGAYLLVNWRVHGSPTAFLGVQRSHWAQRPVLPWQPLVDAVRALAAGATGDHRFIHIARLASASLAVIVLAAGVVWLRLEDQIYAWTGLLLVMGASWLISLPRYLLAIYPLFLVLGRLTRRRPVFLAVMAVSVLAQGWLFTRYAAGRWTF